MITILLYLVIAAIILGLIMWVITVIPGMDPVFVQVIRVACIVIFVIYLIYILMGLLGGTGGVHPSLR